MAAPVPLSDYETMFAYASSSTPDLSPEMREKGQCMMIEMEKTPEVIDFCLSQFNALQQPTSFSVVFKCIEYRLTYCFDETPPEKWVEVRNLIFGPALAKAAALSEETQNDLAKVQSAFVMKAYPQIVGDVFNAVFQMEDMATLRFLQAFCKRLIIPRPGDIEQFVLVKRSMAEQQIVPAILQKLKGGVIAQKVIAFTAFSHLVRWFPDISWVSDGEFMTAMMQGFTNVEVAGGAFEVFCALMTKDIPSEQKVEIVAKLGILQRLADASALPPEAKPLLVKAANCVERMGCVLLKTPAIKSIHELATRFYMNPDRDVAECVSTYMYLFTLENPELGPAMFEMVMKRTQLEFERDPLNAVGFFLMDNVRILSGLATVSKQAAVVELLEQEVAKVNIEANPAHASAVLFFVTECLRAKYAFPNFPAIFRTFMDPVFSAKPPIPENSWYVVFGFLRVIVFLKPDDSRFRNITQFTKEFMDGMMKFALSPEVSPPMRQKFVTLLLMYARCWHQKLRVTKEIVMNFLGMGCKEMNGVAGALVNGTNAAMRGEIMAEALSGFGALLANPTKENILLVFSFLLEIRDLDPASGQVLGQFLASLMPICATDAELLAMLMRAAVLVKPHGFQMFTELIPKMTSYTSLEKAAETSMLWLHWARSRPSEPASQTILGSDWVSVAKLLFDGLVATYQTSPLLTDQQKTSNALKQCCIAFCEMLPLLPPPLLSDIIAFIKRLITRSYMSVFMLESVLPFISTLVDHHAALAAEQFTETTLLFLFNPDFNPLKKRGRLIDLLIQFHARLSKQRSVYLAFSELLSKTFKRFGADDDFVSRYFKALEGDYRAANLQCQLLLMELTTRKNGLAELIFEPQ